MSSLRPFLAGLVAAAASAAGVMIAVGLIVAIVESPVAVVHPAASTLFQIAFAVALLHVLALGLPFYALTPPEWRGSLRFNLGASVLIGAIPIPLLVMMLTLSGGLESASSYGVQTWVDGHPTIFFFLETLATAAVFGAFGMVGGFTFWLLTAPRGRSRLGS